MKHLFSHVKHDTDGRLVLGEEHGHCKQCSTPYHPIVASNDKAVLWAPKCGCRFGKKKETEAT